MSNNVKNKRIAKNTLMLYVRMLLVMIISLYTSRIILNVLGVEDFGIYNVVGGFVAMIGFLNSSMTSSSQRFLAYEVGLNNQSQLQKTFIMSVNIHFLIAIIILFFSETLGLWILNTQLSIPLDRINAAKWVYQFSILSFVAGVMIVPFNALIIAHERMKIFAWIGIIDVCLKLLLVFSLQWFGFDKLILYAVLMFVVSFLTLTFYFFYCLRTFNASKIKFYWNKTLFSKMLSFSGWSLWTDFSYSLQGQGVNILLGVFFNPAINAARGITFQIIGSVNSFVSNFQIAMNPQIVKSFATGDINYMQQIILRGSKYSFFLLFTLSLPILMETEMILKSWLVIFPNETIIFTRLVLITILIESFSGAITMAVQATGEIKKYQAFTGGILILVLPTSFLFLKYGFNPEVVFYISLVTSFILFIVRLVFLQQLNILKIKTFLSDTFFKSLIVSSISLLFIISIKLQLNESFLNSLFLIIISILSSLGSIWIFGINKKEKEFFIKEINKILKL